MNVKRAASAVCGLALLGTMGSAAVAGSANAASGTKDNKEYVIGGSWYPNGYVYWNDYKDSDHSYDLDDLWLRDRGDDGGSIRLTVYRNGEKYKTAHAYNGERKKVYLWNLRKGERVFWRTCLWDDGDQVDGSCEEHSSSE